MNIQKLYLTAEIPSISMLMKNPYPILSLNYFAFFTFPLSKEAIDRINFEAGDFTFKQVFIACLKSWKFWTECLVVAIVWAFQTLSMLFFTLFIFIIFFLWDKQSFIEFIGSFTTISPTQMGELLQSIQEFLLTFGITIFLACFICRLFIKYLNIKSDVEDLRRKYDRKIKDEQFDKQLKIRHEMAWKQICKGYGADDLILIKVKNHEPPNR